MSDLKKIALVGNPNSGKSSLFNLLTGLQQKISNFPGVTIDKKTGTLNLEDQRAELIDLPGCYSLYPNTSDEKIVVDILSNPKHEDYPDLVVYVADINNIERHLLLATQIIDLKIPMILCLNMIDLYEEDYLTKVKNLEKKLKIPIIPISVREQDGIAFLKHALKDFLNGSTVYTSNSKIFSSPENLIALCKDIFGSTSNVYQNTLRLHHSSWISGLNSDERNLIDESLETQNINVLDYQIQETLQRFHFIEGLSISKNNPTTDNSFTDKIDSIITHRIIGPILFFCIMLFVFQAIYAWSSWPMDMIDLGFSELGNLVNAYLPESWFRSLLVDGIIAGLGGILIFIPQIAILFLIIALLEESGYMSRAVYMFDGLMQRFGLNGRSIVALVSSGACAIPAIMSTRTIGNWKERLITIMVSPLISCSARIPVYAILVAFVVPATDVWGIFNAQGLVFMGLYLLGIVAALSSAYVFKKLLSTNESSYLIMELPQYKAPLWKNVIYTVKEKVMTFVIEAGKVIFVISILLWFLANYGPGDSLAKAEELALTESRSQQLAENETADLIAAYQLENSYAGHIGKFIEPVIRPLGYDWKIGIALLSSFAAREVFVGTMASIYAIGSAEEDSTIRERLGAEINPETNKPRFDLATSLSLLVFYVFAMQCMSTLAVTRRETKSWKWPIIQFCYMTILAYFSALAVYQILS